MSRPFFQPNYYDPNVLAGIDPRAGMIQFDPYTPVRPNPEQPEPRVLLAALGGLLQRPEVNSRIQPIAGGDQICQVCPRGGSFGTTGMYRISGKVMCADCAAKAAGANNLPGPVKVEMLEPYLLKPK